jgi:aminoglycoside/choline kinase family phosphotransferase
MDEGSAAVERDAWLSRALGEAVRVRQAEPFGAGVGLLASATRIELHDGRRLFVKEPSNDARTRSIAQQFGYYAREAGAYRDLLPGAGLATPRCHAIVDTDDGPVLVLDDLADHHVADQLTGATPAQAFAAADFLGDLHARFWDAPALAACAWLPGPIDAVVTMYEHLFAMMWGDFCAMAADFVPAADLRAAEHAVARFADVCAAFGTAPPTFLHGDYRLDNLLFAADGTVAAIDWQLAAWGRGAYDLAFFASGSVDDALLAEIEPELLARYHDRLVANGIEHYALDACRHDYLGGLVMNLPNPVTALVAVPPGNERGARLLRENARRALATAARHAASLSSW